MNNPKNSPHFHRSPTLPVIVEIDDDDEADAQLPKSASFPDDYSQADRLPPKQFRVVRFINETKEGIPLPDHKMKASNLPSHYTQPQQV